MSNFTTDRQRVAVKTASLVTVATVASVTVSVTAASLTLGLLVALPFLRDQQFRMAAVGGGAETAPNLIAPNYYIQHVIPQPGGEPERRFIAQAAAFHALLQTNDNEYLLAGWALTEGKNDQDMYLLKAYGPGADKLPRPDEGQLRWFKIFNLPGNEAAYAVAETKNASGAPDGYLVVGQARSAGDSDIILIKTDLRGELDASWPENPKYIGQANRAEIAYALEVVNDGYLFVGGSASRDDNGNTVDADVWWAKIDRQGRVLGGFPQTWGTAERNESAAAVHRTMQPDGFILAGETTTKPTPGQAPNSDVLLLHLDASGRRGVWPAAANPKILGVPESNETAHSVRQAFGDAGTPHGFVVAGHLTPARGSGDALMFITDRLGNSVMRQVFGGRLDDDFTGVRQTFDEAHTPTGFILTGTTGTTEAGAEDTNVYLVGVDRQGQLVWQKSIDQVQGQIELGHALTLITDNPRYKFATAGQSFSFTFQARSVGQLLLVGWGKNQPARFRRGDADGNGTVNLTDAVFTLNALFQGGPQSACQDASDADDNGLLNLTDPVFTLNYLFRGSGLPPPPPGPTELGADPTEDPLTCAVYPGP